MAAITIMDCGHPASDHAEHTTGYGIDAEGKKLCYACCAERDKKTMTEESSITIYLSYDKAGYGGFHKAFGEWFKGRVTNWPGSLEIKASIHKGRHNVSTTRYDCWFIGPDGKTWYGVQYGEFTQVVHCRKLRS